jgi:hypothetical protein
LSEIRNQTANASGAVKALTQRVDFTEALALNQRVEKIEAKGRYTAGWVAGAGLVVGGIGSLVVALIKYWPVH